MEELLLDILAHVDELYALQGVERSKALEVFIRRHNQGIVRNEEHLSKKKLVPFYLKTKADDAPRWEAWGVSAEQEQKLISVLQIKPRRTASGVATITVLTKPWKCSSNCVYCPNDLTMPKSYLGDEPACQRAERNYFDPYLQVSTRLQSLMRMGHVTDKVELIVLGGTWNDYPEGYQIWFISELFRALNDCGAAGEMLAAADSSDFWGQDADGGAASSGSASNESVPSKPASVVELVRSERLRQYKDMGLTNDQAVLRAAAAQLQQRVHAGETTYNEAWEILYQQSEAWQKAAGMQVGDWDSLARLQRENEMSTHRMVGLVVETRPDTLDPACLTTLRRLGCTKVQMGVQTLDPVIQKVNHRSISNNVIARAFMMARLWGFKIHAHFMVNLLGSNPEADIADYRAFVSELPFQPDEIKLYPCVLIEGTQLCERYRAGQWLPYEEEELVSVLAEDVLATPPFIRISRMIRDFSAHDIVAGSKKINLRQRVEDRVSLLAQERGEQVREIRFRELGTNEAPAGDFRMTTFAYETQGTSERFLQWETDDGHILGFLRLSLPDQAQMAKLGDASPVKMGEAMIREVHVYGKVAQLHKTSGGAQHLGLGRQLILEASRIARGAGYERLNVISSVGTREYYRKQGFADNGLYQQKNLMGE